MLAIFVFCRTAAPSIVSSSGDLWFSQTKRRPWHATTGSLHFWPRDFFAHLSTSKFALEERNHFKEKKKYCCVVLCCLHDMISVAPPTSADFGASEINMSSLIWSTYCLRSWKCRFLSLVSELVFLGTPLYFRRWLAFWEKSGVEKMTTTEEWKWRQQENENGDNRRMKMATTQ